MKQLLLIIFFYSHLTWGQTENLPTPDFRHHVNLPDNPKENVRLQQTATSGGVWTELYPKAPRVHYLCIHFANIDTGWAVGVEGTIIRTVDAGKTWTTIESHVNKILLNINSYKNVAIITGFSGTVLRSEDYGLTWTEAQIPENVTSDLWRVEMLNDTLGWISGKEATLLRTTDAGKTWHSVETGFPNYNYWFVSFYKEKYGYICGDMGRVLKTTDYGETWQERYIGDNKSLYTLTVFDSVRVVTGGEQRVAYTTDGGETWGLTSSGFLVNAMAFVNDSVGYTIGADEYVYYITTNGGVSWGIMGYPITTRIGNNWIEFVNDTLGYIAGNYFRINFTTNSGYNWERKFVMNEDIQDIFFVNEKVGFVLDEKYFYKTTDGGYNWQRGKDFFANAIYFLDTLNGFLGGQSHRIYATTDGGVTWFEKPITGLSDSSFTSIEGFFFINDSVGYAYSLNGIYRTINYGLEWKQISSTGAVKLQFLTPSIGYNIWGERFYISSDSGNTWQQRAELQPDNYDDLLFIDSMRGFTTGNHKLFHTSNGGISWSLMEGINGFGKGNLCWFTKQNGLLTGIKVYGTNTAGSNWDDITAIIGTGFGKMYAVESNLGYGGGNLGMIIKYEDTTTVSVKHEEEKLIYNLSLKSYPNPFNSTTIVIFTSPFTDYGTVKIYSILGEEVAVLFSDLIERNKEYKVKVNTDSFSSGFYLCRLQTQQAAKTIKLTIIK